MNVSLPLPRIAVPARADSPALVDLPQLGRRAILAVWAAAALPMAALAWIVAPIVADRLGGAGNVPMAKALVGSLAVGLAWQFVLVLVLVRREQGTLRPSVLRRALWLQKPRSPRTGCVGGRLWLLLVPLTVLFAAQEFLPALFSVPVDHDMAAFLESDAAADFLAGNWIWFAVIGVQLVLNTVLGEELLFRGYLLPRMNGAFGRGDWLANGFLFAAYHLHMPWAFLAPLANAFVLAYPTKRFRSAWIGIAVHSAQSVFIAIAVLALVV